MSETNFDFDLLTELAEQAPTAGFGPQRNFGKIIGTVTFNRWDAGQGKFIERPYDNKPGKEGETIRLTLKSDLSEFNPALVNEYKRQVDVRKSRLTKEGAKDPKALTDWTETVQPAFLAVLGKDYFKKIIKGVYAEWEDVETVELDKTGRKKGFDKKDPVTREVVMGDDGKAIHYTNTTPRLLRVFKSKAECATAREERFGSKNVDEDFDADEIPANIVAEVKGVFGALGLDEFEEYIRNNAPYNQYDHEKLMQAVNPI